MLNIRPDFTVPKADFKTGATQLHDVMAYYAVRFSVISGLHKKLTTKAKYI